MKKHLLYIWLACVGLAWTALGQPSFRSLPDYMVTDHCDPFSKSAVAYLTARGIPAVRITYGWSAFGAGRGYHAAVLFKWNGKFYFMDNARMGPVPVAGQTDLGCIRRVHGQFGTMLWMVQEDKKRVGPRPLKEIFP
jgi:hypothetical protein